MNTASAVPSGRSAGEAFDRIPGDVVYARLLHTLRLENERGEVIVRMGRLRSGIQLREQQWQLYVCIASHRVNIEPDDTYIRLIYDRLGEHVALEIRLPEGRTQP